MNVSPKSGELDGATAALVGDNAVELKSLSGALIANAGEGEIRTLLVTSSHAGEGKTLAAVGLAGALAEHLHSRVLLVDANFGAPRLQQLYSLPAAPGLADVLSSGGACRPLLHGTEHASLNVVTTTGLRGSVGRREAAVLQQLLAELKADFDYVVVDGSHYFASSDVALFAQLFDGIAFVIQCEKTRWEVVQQASDGLRKAGGRLLGAVLNRRRYYIPRKLYGLV